MTVIVHKRTVGSVYPCLFENIYIYNMNIYLKKSICLACSYLLAHLACWQKYSQTFTSVFDVRLCV